jgi:hypothetical protein
MIVPHQPEMGRVPERHYEENGSDWFFVGQDPLAAPEVHGRAFPHSHAESICSLHQPRLLSSRKYTVASLDWAATVF